MCDVISLQFRFEKKNWTRVDDSKGIGQCKRVIQRISLSLSLCLHSWVSNANHLNSFMICVCSCCRNSNAIVFHEKFNDDLLFNSPGSLERSSSAIVLRPQNLLHQSQADPIQSIPLGSVNSANFKLSLLLPIHVHHIICTYVEWKCVILSVHLKAISIMDLANTHSFSLDWSCLFCF